MKPAGRRFETGCSRWFLVALLLVLHVLLFPARAWSGEEGAGAEETSRGIPVEIPQWRFALRLPSTQWKALDVQDVGEGSNRRVAYTYKRAPIRDSEGRPIEPAIGFIFRPVPEGADPILWIGFHRARHVKAMGGELVEALTKSLRPGLQLGLGWLMRYERGGIEHTVKLVGAINGDIGLQVFMDSTTDVFPAVERYMSTALRHCQR